MNQNKVVVCAKTMELLVAAHRLSKSLDRMKNALGFIGSEISCGQTIDQSRIDSLVKITEAIVTEGVKALLAWKKGISKRKIFSLTKKFKRRVS